MSFVDVRDEVFSLASSLPSSLGLKPGSRVALSVENEINHFLSSVALMVAGVSHVTLATHDSPEVNALIMRRLGVSKIVNDSDVQAARQSTGGVPHVHPQKTDSFGEIYLRTSGSVGHAKIVPFSAEDLIIQARRNTAYGQGTRFVRWASMQHNNSKKAPSLLLFNGRDKCFC